MRLAKFLAHTGVASRRKAEELISQEKVTVDGQLVADPAFSVQPEHNVYFNNQLLTLPEPKIWLYNKPRGLVTTHSDPEGRPTVFSSLPITSDEHLISVGRLDINSEGLLLITNSRIVARYLEHPNSKIPRVYHVKCFGDLNERSIEKARQAMTIDGVHLAPCKIDVLSTSPNNQWLSFELKEGKNREIRRRIEYLGLKVSRLIRLQYGPFVLGKIKKGEVSLVKKELVNQVLKDASNH